MSEIKNVSITAVDANPYRDLDNYPWVEHKLDHLQHSIEDVGLWEGIIVRQLGKRYQMAFGHHRLEAAKRAKLKKANVIVRKLTDEEMLKFMGRENGEDYGTEFLIMLNTWEGAITFARDRAQQPLDTARLLGWTRYQSDGNDRMTDVATACNAAHRLVGGGYLNRDDLGGLSVSAAKEILTRAMSNMDRLDKMAKTTNRPKESLEEAKSHVATGARRTATKARRGEVAQRDLRGSVEVEAYKSSKETRKKSSPLFDVFGARLGDQIAKMLSEDSAAAKLSQMSEVIEDIALHEDAQTLKRIEYELDRIADRAKHWRKRLTPKTKSNVVRIDKLLEERA